MFDKLSAFQEIKGFYSQKEEKMPKIRQSVKVEAIRKASMKDIENPHKSKITRRTLRCEEFLLKTQNSKGTSEIEMHPVFQRYFAWNTTKMSALLNTMLNSGYIAPIVIGRVVSEDKTTGNYCVVDGGNRCETIRRFLQNQYAVTGLFAIDDNKNVILDPTKPINRYVGKKFSQLPEEVQEHFRDYELNFVYEDVKSPQALTDEFILINDGGVPMKQDNIIFCKYRETEIGKAILSFLQTETGKALVGVQRLWETSLPRLFKQCAGFMAESDNFLKYMGDSGTDSFLFIHSHDDKESSLSRIQRFQKAVQTFNQSFLSRSFKDRRYRKDQAVELIDKPMEKANRVKSVILSVLFGQDDHEFILKNRDTIWDNLQAKLNAGTAFKSNLYELLTVSTTQAGRREQAMAEIKRCMGL